MRILDLKSGKITEPKDSPFKLLKRRKCNFTTSWDDCGSKTFNSLSNENIHVINNKAYTSGYDYSTGKSVTFEIDLQDFSYKTYDYYEQSKWVTSNNWGLVFAGGATSSNSSSENSDSGTKAVVTETVIIGSGGKLISRNPDGSISIGSHSVRFGDEQVGDQTMWATDQNGIVDLNITNGTDLKVNGVSIQGQINQNKDSIKQNASRIETNRLGILSNSQNISTNQKNIESNRQNINYLGFGVAGATALSTAMTALPTVSDDSPLSCGVGTGGYSSRYAMSVGCAVKASERLSFNAGGSYVFGGAADYGNGSLSNVAGRAGFVFKLGKIQSSSKGDLQARVKELENANQAIQEENAAIKSTNKALIARLERLEAIASSVLKQNSVASK